MLCPLDTCAALPWAVKRESGCGRGTSNCASEAETMKNTLLLNLLTSGVLICTIACGSDEAQSGGLPSDKQVIADVAQIGRAHV